jgi:putative spermidine/putrescine transport system permease protein
MRTDAGLTRKFRIGALLAWPGLALVVFVLIPFVLLLRISIAPTSTAGLWGQGVSFGAYGAPAEPEVIHAMMHSLVLAAVVALISLGLGFPLTYLIARMRRRQQVVWLVFLLATLSLSDVLIAFSWQVMLAKRVGLSKIFVALGLMSQPDSLTPSDGAVIACLVYLVMPFTVLTLYPVLSRLDRSLIEAARTLGASPPRAFFSVVMPLTRGPATVAFVMAAVLTLGAYAPPIVLGRPESWPMAVLIGSAALAGHDLPRASAMSVFLLGVTALIGLAAIQLVRIRRRR